MSNAVSANSGEKNEIIVYQPEGGAVCDNP